MSVTSATSLRQRLTASLVRRYPFYSGAGSLANSKAVRLMSGSSDTIAWGRVHGGHQVAAPLDDYVGRAIYFAGDLDPKITWACRKLVRLGDTVLDIGANLGLVTFILCALVGPQGRVHAFEPIPRMQGLIEHGIERNGVHNVTLHPFALGAQECALDLSVPADHAGRASFVAHRSKGAASTIRVPVKRLDDVLQALGMDHIRLVKIDVEGFEAQVFEGAATWFRKHPPDAILFELNGTEARMGDSRAVQILDALGYRFFALPKRMLTMRARAVQTSDARPDDAHDFVAVHRTTHLHTALL